MRKTKFVTGNYYHVLNRGNERNAIFFETENYLFFLRRLKAALEKYGPQLIMLLPDTEPFSFDPAGDC